MNRICNKIITRMAMCPSPKRFEAIATAYAKKIDNQPTRKDK